MGARRVAVPILLTALALSGCGGWRSYQRPDDAAPLPGVLRLSLRGDSVVTLHDPALEGDSVYVGTDGAAPASTLRIPVHRVEGVEVPVESQAVEVLSGAAGLVLGGALLAWLFGQLGI